MKILVAYHIRHNDTNPFILLTVRSFCQQPGVKAVWYGPQLFWGNIFEIDVIHFHQPEVLFGFREPTNQQLKDLQTKIGEWKQNNTTMIATIHDSYPHYRNTSQFQALFEILYSAMDGFTHRGVASVSEFNKQYPNLKSIPHTLIPAGINSHFTNKISKEEARKYQKLEVKDKVFLVFGNIRDFEEISQILQAFKRVQISGKKLIISAARTPYGQRFRRFYYDKRLALSKDIVHNFSQVDPDMVQFYVTASDVLIIARTVIVNSATIQLAFAFGKVVIGPDMGVVGEILRATGNPVFKPHDPDSIALAMQEGLVLQENGHGQKNRAYAEQHWNWTDIANAHFEFFQQIHKAQS